MRQKIPYDRMFPNRGPARGQCPQGTWRGNEPVCPRPGHSYYPPVRVGRPFQDNQGRQQQAWHTGAWQQPMPRREEWQEETGPSDPMAPQEPTVPEAPEYPVLPEEPEAPQEPVVPECPECPECPSEPEAPEEPVVPECPECPECPSEPEMPEEPEKPECPECPECPSEPEAPEEPEMPECPECPEHPCPPCRPSPCPPCGQPMTPEECQKMQHYTPLPQRPIPQACRQNGCITDNQGAMAQNDNHSLTVGCNGPMLMKDAYYLEKMAHFDRERIPERVVHANGTGAFGYFQTTCSMARYTKAGLFSQAGKVTPVFVRFSTVAGHKGSADTLRDPRGFAVKFYTEEGNLDIVGLNFPVFFIRDAMKFPDLLHSLKPAPDTGVKDNARFWDFYSQMPECTNMITYLYSDEGTIPSYRKMDGFGVNTYVWVNSQGERFYVKYHFRSHQGKETVDRHEAARLAGVEPDVAKTDLYRTLESGQTAAWDLAVQLMPICQASMQKFDPLDDTKLWPEEQFPLHKVGQLVLNRNFENEFVQVEQSAFCPANLVPGIEFSDDKMLAGRVFSYGDAQRYRVGPNYTELPINRPRTPANNYQQDGMMRTSFRKGTVNYYPHSGALGCGPQQKTACPPYTAPYSRGNQIRSPLYQADDFTQAGERFRGMSRLEQEHLADNIAVELAQTPAVISGQCLEYFRKACPQWADMVEKAMKGYENRH